MRLMSLDDNGLPVLTDDLVDQIPGYACLSHTWGSDSDEPTYQEVANGHLGAKHGYRKVEFCARQAASDGLKYFWIDSCCIDKTNNTELSQAINSMFRWYARSEKCYVYLSDVSTTGTIPWEQQFPRSRWFTRGWTLQELLAPKHVEFFSTEGVYLGSKSSLARELGTITGIQHEALVFGRLSQYSPRSKMLWTQGRQTKIEEDKAYSMLGIFDVYLPLIYGEGLHNALIRLEHAIAKKMAFEHHARPGM